MHSKVFYGLLVVLFIDEALAIRIGEKVEKNKVLARRKRYVVFPEGSSFSVSFYIVIIHHVKHTLIILPIKS